MIERMILNKIDVTVGVGTALTYALIAPSNEIAIVLSPMVGIATPYLGKIVHGILRQPKEVHNEVVNQAQSDGGDTRLPYDPTSPNLQFAGPNAEADLGHATAVLTQLQKARGVTDEQYSHVPGNRTKAIKNFQAIVRGKVARGELKPEALERFNIPPEE